MALLTCPRASYSARKRATHRRRPNPLRHGTRARAGHRRQLATIRGAAHAGARMPKCNGPRPTRGGQRQTAANHQCTAA
eukprot:10847858-Lingulodinium_polyedra.AAC.1